MKPAINHWTDLCRTPSVPRIVPTLSRRLSLRSRRCHWARGRQTHEGRNGSPPAPEDPTALMRGSRRVIFVSIFMATTVHIPDPLLKSVDRRAKALGISRNRLVVRALEQAVRERSGWTPEFLERLRRVDSKTSAASDELLNAVKQARRSKEPHEL